MEQPFIERNFHILNDDRFLMEKISLPIEMQEGEDIHDAINRTRETIVQNFKAAYPKVEESLNFHVVRQVDKGRERDLQDIERQTGVRFTAPEEPKYPYGRIEVIPIEKINKGTIEEQIEACTQIEGKEDWCLKSFEIFVNMNKKYQPVYDAKYAELSNKEITNTLKVNDMLASSSMEGLQKGYKKEYKKGYKK